MGKQTLVNPFEDDIVSEPRHIEKSVSKLNDEPLEELLRRFGDLEKDPLPRRTRLPHAQFVASPHAGYGKSHLIGRLFQKLSQRATLVYLRPFEDASTCWKTILLKTVQELDFPDRVETKHADAEEPTQLEVFAHGIIVHLITDAIESEAIRVKNKQPVLNFFHKVTVQKFRNDKKWLDWTRRNYNSLVKQCSQQLQRNGIRLYASPFSWLGALITCAYFPSEFELRETCSDWLQGGSIDLDDAKRIGIKPRDIPNAEMAGGEINELCKNRLIDFCQLAGFFRPFVFCFDQTENYGKEIILAKTLGSVVQALVDESCNQMTVVTANQIPWSESIRPWWQDAYLHRMSDPLELEGLDRDQACELINQRFDGLDIETEKARFVDNKEWLNGLFQHKELGIRDFLQRCSNRWQVCIGKTTELRPISDCYKKAVEEIKTQPRRLVFDPPTLYWLVYEVASGLPDLKVEKYKSQKGYFTLLWKLEDRKIFFGFEGGSNWKRWQAIAREAGIHHDVEVRAKTVMLRTPELGKIPGKWKIAEALEEAKQKYLHIMQLEKSEMTKLYAAHDLYVDAQENNIQFQRHEILGFVRNELGSFWERIKKPLSNGESISKPSGGGASETGGGGASKPGGGGASKPGGEGASETGGASKPGRGASKPGAELIGEIRNILQRDKFLSVNDLMKKLSQPVTEEMLHEARGHIPEIKVHVSPDMTVFQWQSSKSV